MVTATLNEGQWTWGIELHDLNIYFINIVIYQWTYLMFFSLDFESWEKYAKNLKTSHPVNVQLKYCLFKLRNDFLQFFKSNTKIN